MCNTGCHPPPQNFRLRRSVVTFRESAVLMSSLVLLILLVSTQKLSNHRENQLLEPQPHKECQ